MPSGSSAAAGRSASQNPASAVLNSDLGYASDVCDYNVTSTAKKKPEEASRPASYSETGKRKDNYYVQNQNNLRQVSMVSLKPLSPALESSLYDRRRKIIQKRASVFQSEEDLRSLPLEDEDEDASQPVIDLKVTCSPTPGSPPPQTSEKTENVIWNQACPSVPNKDRFTNDQRLTLRCSFFALKLILVLIDTSIY